jgi:hypothetical protein
MEGQASHVHLVDPSHNNGDIGLTARNWKAPSTRSLQMKGHSKLLRDCPLLRLAHNVAHIPQGNNRGLLTMAIEHAQINNHWSVCLSELSVYVAKVNILGPSAPALATVDAAARVNFCNTYRGLHP